MCCVIVRDAVYVVSGTARAALHPIVVLDVVDEVGLDHVLVVVLLVVALVAVRVASGPRHGDAAPRGVTNVGSTFPGGHCQQAAAAGVHRSSIGGACAGKWRPEDLLQAVGVQVVDERANVVGGVGRAR